MKVSENQIEDLVFKQAGGVSFILSLQIINVFNHSEWIFSSNYSIIVISFVATLIYLANYIRFHLLPNKAEQLLKETYPEFNLC